MEVVKSFGDCNYSEDELKKRLDVLRRNIAKYSENEFIVNNSDRIGVEWHWTNFFSVRIDNDNHNNIRIEIWVADTKQEWEEIKNKSNMSFVKEQQSSKHIDELNIDAEYYVGAYIKLSSPYRQTLKVADFKLDEVKNRFNKGYYDYFYNYIAGQYKKNRLTGEFVKDIYSLDEIENEERYPLVPESRKEFMRYLKEEAMSTVSLSLGTTINLSIPIEKLAEKDKEFDVDKGIDNIAEPLYKYIMNCKKMIENQL